MKRAAITNTVETQKSLKEKIDSAVAVIDSAVRQFQPKWVFALFSGGHDSLTASYIASMHPSFYGCVHINTGIGIWATRDFAQGTCNKRGWRFLEYRADENCRKDGTKDPMIYEDIVMKHGFPGPDQHRVMYVKLKERQIRRLCREYKGRVMLISGARKEESVRRMGNTAPLQISGNLAWCAPIHNWTKAECSELLTAGKFWRNETALRFGRSGECLCGAFAKPGELAVLEFACPISAERIRKLERKVRANGFPWGWEDPGPPDWWKEKNQGQQFMFGYDEDETLVEEHLCTSCKWRAL